MPWCDACNRYASSDSLGPEGECPSCGRPVATAPDDVEGAPHAPWHFRLLVTAAVLYLAWRAYYGVVWLLDRG